MPRASNSSVHRLIRWIKTFAFTVRKESFSVGVNELAKFVWPKHYLIYKLDLEVNLLEIDRAPARSEISAISITDGCSAIECLKNLRNRSNLPEAFYRDLRDDTWLCVLAMDKEDAVGVAWLYQHNMAGPFLKLFPGDLVLRHLYVLKPFRGRQIAAALVERASLCARISGCQSLYAVVRSENKSSEAVFRKVGFKRVAELRRSTLFGQRYNASSHL